MKNVMQRAWEIAKEGAKKFGGKAIEYITESLRMAWAEFKNSLEQLAKKVEEYVWDYDMQFVKANVWEKYGKRRIYVNYQGEKLGFLEFDKNGKYIKGWVERHRDVFIWKASTAFKSCKEWLERGFAI